MLSNGETKATNGVSGVHGVGHHKAQEQSQGRRRGSAKGGTLVGPGQSDLSQQAPPESPCGPHFTPPPPYPHFPSFLELLTDTFMFKEAKQMPGRILLERNGGGREGNGSG